MKRRYTYSILFGIPGLILSFLITLMVAAGALGILWLFVFGDDPWPDAVNIVLPAALGLVFLALVSAFVAVGYWLGKQREADPAQNRLHILVSAAVTLALLVFVLLMVLFR